MWTLFVPEGNYIWLNFSRFDIEPETFCDYDSLSVYSKDNRLIGELLSPYSVKLSQQVCPVRTLGFIATESVKCKTWLHFHDEYFVPYDLK